jgi:hypothetical protein
MGIMSSECVISLSEEFSSFMVEFLIKSKIRGQVWRCWCMTVVLASGNFTRIPHERGLSDLTAAVKNRIVSFWGMK